MSSPLFGISRATQAQRAPNSHGSGRRTGQRMGSRHPLQSGCVGSGKRPAAQERKRVSMKIGFWELVVIVIVAFVFIGPDQLPVYAKKIGKMLRELKKYTGAASEEIQKNVVEPLNEIQAPLKEAVAPLTDIKKDIDNSVKDVTKSFTGIGKTSKEEAAKAEAAEEVTELTEEPVEELEEDAAPAAKAEESAPAEETAAPAEKAEEPTAPVEKAKPAVEAAPAQEAAEAAPAAEPVEEDPRQNDVLPKD